MPAARSPARAATRSCPPAPTPVPAGYRRNPPLHPDVAQAVRPAETADRPPGSTAIQPGTRSPDLLAATATQSPAEPEPRRAGHQAPSRQTTATADAQ